MMDLCKICQVINRRQWKVKSMNTLEGEWIKHHESYRNLCKSVSEGCRLCTLLRNGLLDSMRDYALSGHVSGYWEANSVELWQLETDGNEPDSTFWIVQQQTFPGYGKGIQCDRALLTGFFYRRCPVHMAHGYPFLAARFAADPCFQFQASSGKTATLVSLR